MTLPKQITKKIKGMNQQTFNQLVMKDIWWMILNHPNVSAQKLSRNFQLQSMNIKISYANGEKYIEASFPKGTTVRFGPQYFKRFSNIKFASLVFLILDEFGPIRNPMSANVIEARNVLGKYKEFPSRQVLRNSLKHEPVFQSLLFMTTILAG